MSRHADRIGSPDGKLLFVHESERGAYESFCVPPPPEIADDIAFYIDAAHRYGGPVLELACGTGRVARGLAGAGFDVCGVDASDAMLGLAQSILSKSDETPEDRVTFVGGQLEDFDLSRRFPLIVIPFRSFHLLYTPQAQINCLHGIAAHLAPGGAVILHIFDPRLEFLTGQAEPPNTTREGRSWVTGKRIRKTRLAVEQDMMAQLRCETWRHEEYDDNGHPCRQEDLELCVRWTHRHEFAHLIARTGFAIEQEFSNFKGAPPVYGGERVIILRQV